MNVTGVGHQSRILCIGLGEDLCNPLALKLEPLGYRLIVVSTFAEALVKINTETFDHYLLADDLADGTGLNLCKLIRKTDGQTPIIFYSKDRSPAVVKKALQMGANAFFSNLEDLEFE